ncbi:MAG: IgGFc-binding protein [Spirochaetota bacterium]
MRVDGGALEGEQIVTIAPGELERLLLPWVDPLAQRLRPDERLRPPVSAYVPGGAYRIRSDVPIKVVQANPAQWPLVSESEAAAGSATMDWSPLLAVRAIGRHYVVATRPSEATVTRATGELRRREGGFLAIVGVAPRTRVEVRLPTRTAPGPTEEAHEAGDTVTRELASGDVWLLVSGHADGPADCPPVESAPIPGQLLCDLGDLDLTGTEVIASEPVAAFAGHACANVPFQHATCDHLEQQLLPVEQLGTSYALVAHGPPGSRNLGLVRVVSPMDGNEITVGDERILLGRGEWIERRWSGVLEIRSEHPSLVMQFAPSANFHGAPVGDPSMFQPIPRDRWQTRYDLVVPHIVVEWAGASPGWGAIHTVTATGSTPIVIGGRPREATRLAGGGLDVHEVELREPGLVTVTSADGAPFGLTFTSASHAVSIAYGPL